MRIVKRSLSVLLSILILISVLSIAPAYAAETDLNKVGSTYSGSTGDCTWELDTATGVLTISGNGKMGSYKYSNDVPWNSYKNSIKTVVINKGVTSIGGEAFEDCTSLTSVTIPNSVTSIGSNAFDYCISLTSVTIPNSVKSIGDFAFFDCDSLTSVTISNNVKSIGSYAFESCTSLTSVTIPNSVTFISDFAFYGCTSLKNVYYTGTSGQWNSMSIGSGNTPLTSANIHYNYYGTIKPTQHLKKAQTITAKSYTKTYYSKAFNLKAKAKTKLSYKTSNKKVVTVSSKGKVTIKGCGKATITINAAATSAYKSATKKITVTVKPGKVKATGYKKGSKITFKPQKGVDGYIAKVTQISGSYKKTITAGKKSKYISLKSLPKGKFRVKISAWKKISGKKVYGQEQSVIIVKG